MFQSIILAIARSFLAIGNFIMKLIFQTIILDIARSFLAIINFIMKLIHAISACAKRQVAKQFNKIYTKTRIE